MNGVFARLLGGERETGGAKGVEQLSNNPHAELNSGVLCKYFQLTQRMACIAPHLLKRQLHGCDTAMSVSAMEHMRTDVPLTKGLKP